MSLVRWNPARELATFPGDVFSMQREINKMFDNFFRGGAVDDGSLEASLWSPAVDVAEHEDEFQVKVELPGVSKDDVKITMQDNILTVRGEKMTLLFNELKSPTYYRVFNLGDGIDRTGIDAKYEEGVLTIKLFKKDETKPREIEIK